jgi:hypothetical protein
LFSQADVSAIVREIFAPALAQNIAVVVKSAKDMPAGDPIYHYVGRTSDGKFTIWRNPDGGGGLMTESKYWQAMTAAYALAAMDSGSAGAAWQTRFQQAPDPLVLGRAFALNFQRESDDRRTHSLASISWVKKTIVIGMTRTAAYELCPGVGQPSKFVPNPDASVDFELGFTIACGTDETLTLSFNLRDKLTSIRDSGARETCL